MYKLILFLVLIMPLTASAETIQYNKFQQIFTKWTNAFNSRNLVESCALFSSKVSADYRGVPKKNYELICNGFKRVFNNSRQQYVYRFKLHSVYMSGNLAAARITWYLDIFEKNKMISHTQDEGLDVFEKDNDGEWKIIEYLGYSV